MSVVDVADKLHSQSRTIRPSKNYTYFMVGPKRRVKTVAIDAAGGGSEPEGNQRVAKGR